MIPEYVQRMADELAQLMDKTERLHAFMDEPRGAFGDLDRESKTLLRLQSGTMMQYAQILRRRIELETERHEPKEIDE